jgi:hypothetical protein
VVSRSSCSRLLDSPPPAWALAIRRSNPTPGDATTTQTTPSTEAVNRLDLSETQTQGISGLMEDVSHAGAKGKTSGAIEAVKETVGELFHRDDEGEDQDAEEDRSGRRGRRRSQPAK